MSSPDALWIILWPGAKTTLPSSGPRIVLLPSFAIFSFGLTGRQHYNDRVAGQVLALAILATSSKRHVCSPRVLRFLTRAWVGLSRVTSHLAKHAGGSVFSPNGGRLEETLILGQAEIHRM